MQAMRMNCWVDTELITRLHDLRGRRPHAPTLTKVATHALELGIEAVDAEDADHVGPAATVGGARRTLTLRLPTALCRKVEQVSRTITDTGTISSALHYLLWLGVNRMQQELRTAEAA